MEVRGHIQTAKLLLAHTLTVCFFFPTKENIPSDRPTSNQTRLRRVSITYGRGRRLVSGINPPDWYERQTAVSTLEFRSQTVSPLLQAIAPLLIDHLIKSRSAPNQASQISAFFFFFFSLCLEIGPSFFCVLHQLCRLRSRLTFWFELVLLMFPSLCRTENVAGFQPANQHPFSWDGKMK